MASINLNKLPDNMATYLELMPVNNPTQIERKALLETNHKTIIDFLFAIESLEFKQSNQTADMMTTADNLMLIDQNANQEIDYEDLNKLNDLFTNCGLSAKFFDNFDLDDLQSKQFLEAFRLSLDIFAYGLYEDAFPSKE